MWFIIGLIIGSICSRYDIRSETKEYGYFRLDGKYYYPEDEIRKQYWRKTNDK